MNIQGVLGEPIGFGAYLGHLRAVEHSDFSKFESFSKGSRQGHLQLGEPGFRSSFSLLGCPNDAGFLTRDIRSFDSLRRRKAYIGRMPTSMKYIDRTFGVPFGFNFQIRLPIPTSSHVKTSS
ncbi:hypothetical protein VNO77_37616 [Canavalia gladiata]|uniref:Uncharacterized protein n=1 Tax=Canavalia gladiata TaxID=3824 RepID=A0AAN9KA84_CANGL